MSASASSPLASPAYLAPSSSAGADPGACWTSKGVYGSGTCPELKQHVHCHHCPVFSAAGLQLLERPLAPDYRAERSAQFAVQRQETEADSISAVIFRAGTEWLGLPATVLQEVAERKPIHSLPHRRGGFIVGLANIRGELLVCISLAHLLRLPTAGLLEDVRRSCSRILVVQFEGVRSAFPVDEVHGPLRFHSHLLRRLPEVSGALTPACARQIVTWNDRVVGLMDADLLFPALNQNFT